MATWVVQRGRGEQRKDRTPDRDPHTGARVMPASPQVRLSNWFDSLTEPELEVEDTLGSLVNNFPSLFGQSRHDRPQEFTRCSVSNCCTPKLARRRTSTTNSTRTGGKPRSMGRVRHGDIVKQLRPPEVRAHDVEGCSARKVRPPEVHEETQRDRLSKRAHLTKD